MLNRKIALASLLATLMPVAMGACGSDKPSGGGKNDGGGGTGGNRPPDGGRADVPALPPDAGREAPPPTPDVSQAISYTFDMDTQGWLLAPYGSTPANMPTAANNLGVASTLVFDPANDVDGKATSGAMKGTVPYRTTGERVDFQAFSIPEGMYNWTGHMVTARVKLESGGNLNPSCPLVGRIYVSQAPDYVTDTSPAVPLVTGSWVTLTFDVDLAPRVNRTLISQMGVQFSTGNNCNAPGPDGGTGDAPDGREPDTRPPDTAPDTAVTDAPVTDAGANDGGDAGVVLPITATTAVIFVDNVVVSVK